MLNSGSLYNGENNRILELQKKYKAGLISEKDMSLVDKEKLIELYKRQNLMLKQEIEVKKQSLKRRIEKIAK